MVIFDLHQDLLMHLNKRVFFGDHYQTNFSLLERARVSGLIATAFPIADDLNHFNPQVNLLIEKDIQAYRDYVEENEQWSLVLNGEDVWHIGNSDKHFMVIHVEGLNVFEGAPEEWAMLERWRDLGLRSVGLVWNKANNLGGGADDKETGLSELGREVVEWIEEKKMILDCAHMNKKTFWDVAELVKRPVLVTHANARAILNHPRNLTDEQLRAVAKSGGVVGATCVPRFVSLQEDATINDMFLHIDHLYHVMGEDHVAMGTDFGGITSGLIEGLDSIDKIDVVFELMKKRGYTETTIKKIAFENAQRVCAAHMEI